MNYELNFETEPFEFEVDSSAEYAAPDEKAEGTWPPPPPYPPRPLPPSIPAGPPKFQLPACRGVYDDFAVLGTHVGALRRALQGRDSARISNARLDVDKAASQSIVGLRSGRHARSGCRKRDFVWLKEEVKKLRAGLPQADQNRLNKVIFWARKTAEGAP